MTLSRSVPAFSSCLVGRRERAGEGRAGPASLLLHHLCGVRVTCLGLNLLPLSLLGDPGPQFLYLHSGANKFCLTSAHELLGEFDESLKGIWESLGGRGLGGSPWGRKTQSLQSQGHDPSTSGSPSHGASVSLYPADEGAEARGEDALADPDGRDLCPEASTSLGAAPRLPSPPPGPRPGCLCRAEPASPGSGEAAGTVPTPWAGGLAGAGRGQLERDSRPGSSITPGCPSGFEGVSWKGELRHLSAHRACHGGTG